MTLGVKQGDPPSPLLLNIAMDPLVKVIDTQAMATSLDPKRSICCACENVLMTEGPDEMNENLALIENFVARLE